MTLKIALVDPMPKAKARTAVSEETAILNKGAQAETRILQNPMHAL